MIRTLTLILLASTPAAALAQDNPLDKVKPINPAKQVNLQTAKHRMEIMNGNRLTVTYFAVPGASDQDIDALSVQARREEEKFNRNVPDLDTPAPAGAMLASVRPGDAPGGPIVTLVLKSGVMKTGELVRATDLLFSLRTADEDFEILRSEVAAMSRKR